MASPLAFPSAKTLLDQQIVHWKNTLAAHESMADSISGRADALKSRWEEEEQELHPLSDEAVRYYKRESDAIRVQLVCELLFKPAHIPALVAEISQVEKHLQLATPLLEREGYLSEQYPKMLGAQSLVGTFKQRAELALEKVNEAQSKAWQAVSSSLNGQPNAISRVTQTLSSMIPLPGEDSSQTTAMYLALQPLLNQEQSDSASVALELSQSMLKRWEERHLFLKTFNTNLCNALDRMKSPATSQEAKTSLTQHIVHLVVFCPGNDLEQEITSVKAALSKIQPFSKPIKLELETASGYTLADVEAAVDTPFTVLLNKVDKIARDEILYRNRTNELIQKAWSTVVPSLGRNPLYKSYDYVSAWVTGTITSIEREQRATWIQAFNELLSKEK